MDDLISRQDAIDANCEDWCGCKHKDCQHKSEENKYCDGCDTVGVLKDLPSAHPENDWIPVTKKAHPDLPFRVQVQMDNGWIITAYYQDGLWLSVPDCGEPIQDKWIEAWRELPEPYTERREE